VNKRRSLLLGLLWVVLGLVALAALDVERMRRGRYLSLQ